MGSAADLAAVVAAAGELRLSLLLQNHRSLSHESIPPKSSVERSAQLGQQLFGFLVGGSSGADADVHTTDLVHLVVLDLREDQLFLQTEGVVATAVEGVGVDATEVTDAGQSHAEQTVQELVHLLAAQGDLDADVLALTELEVSDGLAGLADVPESVIEAFVEKIEVSKDCFRWHLRGDFGGDSPIPMNVEGNRKKGATISPQYIIPPANFGDSGFN